MMTDRLRVATDRIDAGIDKILTAIERGDDPQPFIQRHHDAAPFHLLAIGQAFVADALKRHEDIANDVSDENDSPAGPVRPIQRVGGPQSRPSTPTRRPAPAGRS